jgi:hypothetical protein
MSPWWKAAWIAYAVLIVVIVSAFTLLGCAPITIEGPFVNDTPIEWSTAYDQAGNIYPLVCLGHIEDGLDVDIQPVSHATLQAMLPPGTPPFIELRGHWTGPAKGSVHRDGTILIDRELTPHLYNDAVRHEMCHAKMYRLTGSASWHP